MHYIFRMINYIRCKTFFFHLLSRSLKIVNIVYKKCSIEINACIKSVDSESLFQTFGPDLRSEKVKC